MRLWGAGDLRAGDRLFRRHAPAVARFFRNKVSADLEDLLQQTFLRGLEGRHRFRGESTFCGYLLGIADEPSLAVTDVLHQTYVAMDEEGTEAAAATAVIIGETSAPAGEPISVVLDRPFLFRIVDTHTGATLFLGRIMDPTA